MTNQVFLEMKAYMCKWESNDSVSLDFLFNISLHKNTLTPVGTKSIDKHTHFFKI